MGGGGSYQLFVRAVVLLLKDHDKVLYPIFLLLSRHYILENTLLEFFLLSSKNTKLVFFDLGGQAGRCCKQKRETNSLQGPTDEGTLLTITK